MKLLRSPASALILPLLCGLSAAHSSPSTWSSRLLATPQKNDSSYTKPPEIPDFSKAGFSFGDPPPDPAQSPIFVVSDAPFFADPTGKKDSTKAIQAAIQSAESAGGGVVFFPKGTYEVSLPPKKNACLRISRDGVVLRGEEDGQSILHNRTSSMSRRFVLLVAPKETTAEETAAVETVVSKQVAAGSSLLVVDSLVGLQPGDWVRILQPATDSWIDQFGDPAWKTQSESVTGPVYLRQITEIVPSTKSIHLDLPVRANLEISARVTKIPPPLQNIGIENLTFTSREISTPVGWGNEDYSQPDSAAAQVHRAVLLELRGVANSWIRNLRSAASPDNASGSHLPSTGIRLRNSRSITISDTHLARPQYGGGGGNGYLFDFQNSSDNLLLRCTAEFSRHGFSFAGPGTSGNVLHRCKDKDTGRYTGNSGSEFASGYGSDFHRLFAHANLVDQSTMENSAFFAVYRPFGTSPLHGVASWNNLFWNLRGTGDPDWPISAKGDKTLGDRVVFTQQGGSGAVVGTSGNRSGVFTGAWFPSASTPAILAPKDWIEGISEGTSLQPASLYQFQKSNIPPKKSPPSPKDSRNTPPAIGHPQSFHPPPLPANPFLYFLSAERII